MTKKIQLRLRYTEMQPINTQSPPTLPPPSTQDHNVHPVYRPDIDGLRAVAILYVVVNHAFPTNLRGGFIGVDIFFVISGFLISSIIFRSLKRGDFSFTEFYAHRIKRIFPALIVILAASYTLGWFVLLPDEFKQLGKHIAAGAGFILNFVLWKEAGYFDVASELKPLMHLWSLAIEEQFYLTYPLLIWGAWRLRLNILMVLFALGLLSFGLNISGIGEDAVRTFFMPQTRYWELFAGSVLAYFQLFKHAQFADWLNHWKFRPVAFRQSSLSFRREAVLNNLLSAIGLLLIVAAVITIHKDRPFPGWWALAPVTGTFLLILAGPEAWGNRKILANKLMVFVGVISYPLYLWHWPILSFAQIVGSGTPSHEVQMVAIALSFLLAWLTYQLLERPIRFGRKTWVKTATLSILLALIGYIGYNADIRDGLAFRRAAKINQLANSGRVDRDLSFIVPGCGLPPQMATVYGQCQHDSRGPVKFALLGDSKAASLAPGVFGEATPNGYWLMIGGTLVTPLVPVISNAPQYSIHQALIRPVLKSIIENRDIQVVVLTTATRSLFRMPCCELSIDELPFSKDFDIAFDGLDQAIAKLVQAGKKVVITVDNPTLHDPKQCISRVTALPFINDLLSPSHRAGCHITYDRHLELSRQYRQLLEKLQLKYPDKLYIFDPLDLLCDMKERVCSSTLDGRLMYSYADHISNYASFRIAKRLVPFVESLVNEGSK